MIYAATHYSRDLACGTAGKMLMIAHKIAPKMTEKYLSQIGVEQSKTRIPKDEFSSGNLYKFERDGRVYGDYTEKQKGSLIDWWRVHKPERKYTATIAACATVAAIGATFLKSR